MDTDKLMKELIMDEGYKYEIYLTIWVIRPWALVI